MRRVTALSVASPLTLASWLGADCLAYWLVAPGAEHRMGMHAEHGHAWLGYTPALAVWALTVVVAGLVLCVGAGLRGHRHEYDVRGDVLYVSVSPPREAARTVATPEGHAVDYDESGAVIGMVLVNVRFLLERDGAVTVTQ
jgi:uncharacterized protein YuzE